MRDLSLELHRGEILALLGHNGAGATHMQLHLIFREPAIAADLWRCPHARTTELVHMKQCRCHSRRLRLAL